MIYTVTANPAVDKTVTIPSFQIGAVNRVETLRMDAGGKGINVSKWVRVLGGETMAMGLCGGETGRMIEDSLKADGIPVDFVKVPHATRTNLKIIDPISKTHTDINEPGEPVQAQTLGTLFERLRARVQPNDIVVLAGKFPPGANAKVLPGWIARLSELGAKVYLDAEGEQLTEGVRARPYFIKPNEFELGGLLGRKATELPDIAAATAQLIRQGLRRVCVSLGSRGALFAFEDVTLYGHGLSITVGSTVGAGDATVAALAFADSRGLSPEDSATLAIAAGAASAMQPGTQTAPRSLVESLQKKVVLEKIAAA